MTDELLRRLREQGDHYSDGHGPLHNEAADEIERLRGGLCGPADDWCTDDEKRLAMSLCSVSGHAPDAMVFNEAIQVGPRGWSYVPRHPRQAWELFVYDIRAAKKLIEAESP